MPDSQAVFGLGTASAQRPRRHAQSLTSGASDDEQVVLKLQVAVGMYGATQGVLNGNHEKIHLPSADCLSTQEAEKKIVFGQPPSSTGYCTFCGEDSVNASSKEG